MMKSIHADRQFICFALYLLTNKKTTQSVVFLLYIEYFIKNSLTVIFIVKFKEAINSLFIFIL